MTRLRDCSVVSAQAQDSPGLGKSTPPKVGGEVRGGGKGLMDDGGRGGEEGGGEKSRGQKHSGVRIQLCSSHPCDWLRSLDECTSKQNKKTIQLNISSFAQMGEFLSSLDGSEAFAS